MTPLEMMQLSQGLSDLYVGLETDLIANIAEYLARGDIQSSTAQWKIRMLAQLGALDRMNLQTIAAYAGLAPDLLGGILETAALTAIEELEPGFQSLVREGIIHNTPTSVERTMERALKAYNKQAVNSLNMVNTVMQYKAKAAARKIINDTAELENKQAFLDMLNKAAGKAVTGAESRQAAMRQCIKEMTEKGIPAFVDRAGREWSPEAYINMDIRTTAANTAHQAQFDRMDDYGLHLLSVSSHAGARPKCAKDQGRIFNRSGGGGYTEDLHGNKIRYYAWKDSSYGEPDGLLGINCGHQVYPFVPGLDVQRYFPYDEKENAELYEKTQQQRELERRVRRSKRECMALETVGDEEGLHKASATLKQRQQALRQYCEDNGLSYKPDRTAVVGYNRTVAGKVNAVNRGKTLDISGGSGIIKENHKMSADNGFTLRGKSYAVKSDIDAVKNATEYAKEKLKIGNVDFSSLKNADVIQPMLEQLDQLNQKHNTHFYQILVDSAMDDADFAMVSPDGMLHLNSKYMNSAEATQDFIDRMKKLHLLPKGYESTEYMITHEFMHFVSRGEIDNPRSAIHKLIPSDKTRKKHMPSKNSALNNAEYVADAMAMVELGRTDDVYWNKIYQHFLGGA